MRKSIIIDTDPGPDDALAILMALGASDRLDLLGITTVAGNVPVAQTTINALKVCSLAGRSDTPVYAGCPRPIIRPLHTAEFICGVDGLAGMNIPLPTQSARHTHAVQFLIDTILAQPERSVTVCALGPLTNIASALIQSPEIRERIESLVIMGGARDLGNVTAAAEFNFFVDPHAAHVVLDSGAPIVLLALNATYQAIGTPNRIAPIKALSSESARQITAMLERPRPDGNSLGGNDGHPMHDPCVVAYVLWPHLFTGRNCRVDVEMAEGPTIGRSTIDWWGRSSLKKNAYVIERLDADRMFAEIATAIVTLN